MAKNSSSKHSNTITGSTGVTDGVSVSHCFTLPSSISSSRTTESNNKQKYNASYLSVGFMYTGDEIAPDAPRVLTTKCYQTVLLPAKLHRNHDTNNSTHKDKDISFFKREFKALTHSQSLMVRSSKPVDKNTSEASYRVSYQLHLQEKLIQLQKP